MTTSEHTQVTRSGDMYYCAHCHRSWQIDTQNIPPCLSLQEELARWREDREPSKPAPPLTGWRGGDLYRGGSKHGRKQTGQ
jgi:hypothetical protein